MKDEEFADRFPSAFSVIQQGIERELHHGAQVYISVHGEVLADVGIGDAAPQRPMTPETVLPWLSAAKPLTAVLMARLQERNLLDWDDFVVRHLPEFTGPQKDRVRLRHLLVHTAGLHRVDDGWPDANWSDTIRRICAATHPPDWVVGNCAAYDPLAGWFLLGEIVQLRTDALFAEVLSNDVLQPLEMNQTWAAIPSADVSRLEANLGWMWERQQGRLQRLDWHHPVRFARPSPGSSIRGPIRELGRFYEMLRNRGDGPQGQILSEKNVIALTSRQRIGQFDQTFGHIVDFGLGFLIDSNRYGADTVPYGYGRYCSPRTFGHGGSQSSQGYCDPDHGLVVAYVFNGRPGEPQHQRRAKAFNEAVYHDLGFGG